MSRQETHTGCLGGAGRGLDQFHAAKQRPGLILPSATRGEQLLHRQNAIIEGDLVPAERAGAVKCAKEGGAKNGRRAEAGSFWHRAEQGNLEPTAKRRESAPQGRVRFGGREFTMESRQSQRG